MEKTIHDNYNINYEEWYHEFVDYCKENNLENIYDEDSDVFYNWVYDTLNMNLDDFFTNLKYDKENNTDCIITGTIGKWNGNFDIYPTKCNTLYDAIIKCIRECDYFVITENNGVIHITSMHHDGRNYFEIHKLNDLADDIDEDLLTNEKYHSSFNIQY